MKNYKINIIFYNTSTHFIVLYPNRTQRHLKNPYKAHKYKLCRDLPFYIQATLFILKRQNPLSSPIFSFKAFYDFLQGLGLLSLSSLLSLDIPLFSRLSPWF